MPYGREEERSYSQVQDQEDPIRKPVRYIVEESQTYLARALETFSSPLQRTLKLTRSKSMPSKSQFLHLARPVRVKPISWDLATSQEFKHSLPAKRFFIANAGWDKPDCEAGSIGEKG